MTAADIEAGKGGFQRADLMDYGSLYGMGSYFGEDYTAANLLRLGTLTADNIAKANTGRAFADLPPEQKATVQAAMQSELQGVDLSRPDARLPSALAQAVTALRDEIAQSLQRHDFAKGWTQAYSLDPQLAARTADFLIYSSLTTVAHRPGTNVSWTQNWPYEPLVGNTPTTATFRWTWISFSFTFFAFGAVLFICQRYLNDPDLQAKDPVLAQFRPLTDSQRRIGKYFLVVAAVLLLQILVGAILAHYYSERTSFYGIAVDRFLPFNFLRDVHLQSAIAWIGLSWIASGLFLAPAIGGGEPRGQGLLVDILFWATVVVVGGAVAGNYLGIMGFIDRGWFWFGNQGLSYIQLGRAWQIGFFAALVIWSALMFARCGHRPATAGGNAPILVGSDPPRKPDLGGDRQYRRPLCLRDDPADRHREIVHDHGLLALVGRSPLGRAVLRVLHRRDQRLSADGGRPGVAEPGGALGLSSVDPDLSRRRARHRSPYVLGWRAGDWVPLGTMFSFIEVLPLVLLIIEAINERRLIKAQGEFKYGLAYTYIIGAAFWNFVGAGVFGGTLNAPLVNYYEHATFLTLNHAHTSLFGAFGLLGIGLIYFCLRYAAAEDQPFSEKLGRLAFWLYNAGLVMWIALNFFPIGWPQLDAVFEHGLAYARSQEFYDTTLFWQWMRMPGDIVFALGALLMAWDFVIKLEPFYPRLVQRLIRGPQPRAYSARGAQ
jgi:nitric oxide reductase subunit B